MEDIYLSAAEVAKYVSVHYRTIENWAAQGYLARKDSKYGLVSAFVYRLKQQDAQLNQLKDDPDNELKRQKLIADVDTQKAIALLRNLEVEERQGKLVDASDAIASFQKLIVNAKAKLMGIPNKVALELFHSANVELIKARLMEVIIETLEELSETTDLSE